MTQFNVEYIILSYWILALWEAVTKPFWGNVAHATCIVMINLEIA